jgi:hypothetical protein
VYAVDNLYQNGVVMSIENSSLTASGNVDRDTTLTAAIYNVAPTACGGSGGGGGGGSNTVVFVGMNSAIFDAAVTKPTGTAQNDLILLVCSCNAGAQTITPPAGFTPAGSTQSCTDGTSAVFYKVAGGSEPATYTVVYSDGANSTGCYVYRGASTSTPIDVATQAVYNIAASGTITISTPTATTNYANSLVLWIAACNHVTESASVSYTQPAGYTNRGQVYCGSFASLCVADMTKVATGATGVISGSCVVGTGASNTMGFTVALKVA